MIDQLIRVPHKISIISAFWILVLFIGIPFWLNATSLDRQILPVTAVKEWQSSNSSACPLEPVVHINLISDSSLISESIIPSVTMKLQSYFESVNHNCVKFEFRHQSNLMPEVLADNIFSVELLDMPSTQEITSNSLTLSTNDDPALDFTLIKDHLISIFGLNKQLDSRVVKFAPTYKLVFSLMNQDSRTGDAIVRWDIRNLMKDRITPLLSSLSTLHNFSIDANIQYFAPLTIPVTVNTIDNEGGTIIEEEDLRAFINSAGWNTASSVTLDPVLHFIVYVPENHSRPMRIRTATGLFSDSNAFITPQHGGVVIYNPSLASDLSQSFNLVSHQLSILLGVPSLPSSLDSSSPTGQLTNWQITAVMLRTLGDVTTESVDTLNAIIKLTEDTSNMRVGKDVLSDVIKSLAELDLAKLSISSSIATSLAHVSASLTLSSRAYFNPSMLALLYFPDEHKYAVYTPLFGPVAVPLILTVFKEFKHWREKRRKKKESETKEKDKVD